MAKTEDLIYTDPFIAVFTLTPLLYCNNDSQQVIISRWVDEQKTQYANA